MHMFTMLQQTNSLSKDKAYSSLLKLLLSPLGISGSNRNLFDKRYLSAQDLFTLYDFLFYRGLK
jgi:hypothetical protein